MSDTDDDTVAAVLDALDPAPVAERLGQWPLSRRQTLAVLASTGALASGGSASAQEAAGGVSAAEAVFSNYGSESTAAGYDLTIDDDTYSFQGEGQPVGLPDGADASEIVLPSGATASAVVGPDGSKVFESAIPDSAIHHYPHAAGSGTTLGDDIGQKDGTINNATWTSGTWIDGYALSYDGSGDYVDFGSALSALSISNDWSIAFTIETDDPTATQRPFVNIVGGSDRASVQIESGSLRVGTWNGSSWGREQSFSISQNTTYRLFWAYDSSEASSTLWINNSEETGSNVPNAPSDTGMTLGADPNGSAGVDGLTDDLVIMDATEDATTVQEDYDRQPWT